MSNGPFMALGNPALTNTLPFGAELAIFAVLIPFVAIFLYAAYVELRRWYLFGPSRNKRSIFTFDKAAPGYEAG